MAGQSSSVGESYSEKGSGSTPAVGITQRTNLITNLAICSLRGKLGQGVLAKGDPGRKNRKSVAEGRKEAKMQLAFRGRSGHRAPWLLTDSDMPHPPDSLIHPNPHHSQGFYHVLKLGEAERPGWEGQQSGQKMRLGGRWDDGSPEKRE